jgi:branched-chain amino acid transport system ATP-binding protein
MTQLTADGICVRFGGIHALSDVDLSVASGQIVGLIGPNGAGKTTLFDVLTGLRRPDEGRVRLDDADISGKRAHQRARLGIARTFQRLELFGNLSARENVLVAIEAARRSQPGGARRDTRATDVLRQVGLSHLADTPADVLPTGLARLLELGRALASSPSVILLDEPGSGLSPAETDELAAVLRQLAGDGIAVLLVEHDMRLVMDVCTDVTVLDFGKVIAAGDPDAVRADAAVRAAYLGEETAPAEAARAEAAATATGRPGAARARLAPVEAVPVEAVPAQAAEALRLRDVRAGYGRIEVLHGVSLTVPAGLVYALVGPNGAGKSTLLRVLSGRTPAASGDVLVFGERANRLSASRLARAGVCSVPEGRGIFPNLTVTENLLMFTHRGRGIKARDVAERTFEVFPILAERRGQLAGRLSGGQQQMLAFARALTTSPEILLVDELSMGLAPIVVGELYGILRQVVDSTRLTVVLAEQFAHTALALADRAAVMAGGQIVQEGTPGQVEDAMVASYLGGESQ